jgi:hypothetical protein
MTETAVRDLMRQAMAGYEPQMGPVLGKAVRAARRARRQRQAASAAAAVLITVGLAVGVSAVGGPGHGLQQRAAASAQFVFIEPALPDVTYVRVHPITREYLSQLLLAELPAGAGHSQVDASASSNISGAIGRTATASLSEVTTTIGSGAVRAEMMAVGATDAQFGCPSGRAAGICKVYSLAGGVKVVEEYEAATLPVRRVRVLSFQVQVLRPRVAVVSLSESNRTANTGAVSFGMPLTAAQLLTAAVDPRWQFYVTKPASTAAGADVGRAM